MSVISWKRPESDVSTFDQRRPVRSSRATFRCKSLRPSRIDQAVSISPEEALRAISNRPLVVLPMADKTTTSPRESCRRMTWTARVTASVS